MIPIDSENASQANLSGSYHEFGSPHELLRAVEKVIRETEVVADIGCGIAPMNYFRPKLHFMIEPWREYADILSYRYSGDKSVVVLRQGALEALVSFADNSVDSIFLLDVIEHIEKDVGVKIIGECERVAREQVVIFTPLGFMPQHVEANEPDGWGLSGAAVQEHRSGWLPEDFSSAWSFYVCPKFHSLDFKGEPLEKPYGAFYAVRHFGRKHIARPERLPDFRRPLPAENALQALRDDFTRLQIEREILAKHEVELRQLEAQLDLRRDILKDHELALGHLEGVLKERDEILTNHHRELILLESQIKAREEILNDHQKELSLLKARLDSR